jgi:hypothetical protein
MNFKKLRSMRKLGMGLTFAAMAIFLVASQASAAQKTIFAKTYTKPKGKPVTFTDQIPVSSEVTNLKLSVNNGPGEIGEVKNVSVSINGVEVMTSKDLRETGASEKMVTLPWQQSNELEITLKGQEGNSISIELVGDVIDPGYFF